MSEQETEQALGPRFETRRTADLRRFERNPRTHDREQIEKLKASMREFGFTNPILIDGSDEIIAGHGRLTAAEEIGIARVNVMVIDYLTREQQQALVIADNRLALDAGWDEDTLGDLMRELEAADYDLALTGFDSDEIDDLLEIDEPGGPDEQSEDDDAPETRDRPVSAEGDLWRLGNHRVVVGDSTDEQVIQRLTQGEPADMCWMDPPYNVNYETDAGSIHNDHQSDDDFGAFLGALFKTTINAMREGAAIYIAHADTEGEAFRREFRRAGFKTSGCLIWRKNSLVLGRSDYQWRHEPIIYGWKPGAAHQWFGGRAQTTIHEWDQHEIEQIDDDTYQIGTGEMAVIVRGQGVTLETVHGSMLFEEKPRASADHPTMKPVALIERMIMNSSRRGEHVLDLCGGSGSTLIACEKHGRHARLAEIEPRYADVIVRRRQEFTGRTAALEGRDASFDEIAAERLAGTGIDE